MRVEVVSQLLAICKSRRADKNTDLYILCSGGHGNPSIPIRPIVREYESPNATHVASRLSNAQRVDSLPDMVGCIFELQLMA